MEQKMHWKSFFISFCWFMAGNLLYSLALNLFLVENNIAAGGISGLAMSLTTMIPLRVGTLIFLMNVPLLIASFFIKGKWFTLITLLSSSIHSLTVNLTDALPTLTNDRLVASMFGGVMYGLGLVCLVRANTSSGGTDLLNRLLVVKFPQISVGKMSMIIDGTVVVIAMLVFGDVQVGLYAIITLYISSIFADKVMGGFDRADLCFVITDQDPAIISGALMRSMNRAVTKIDATGMYMGTDRSVLMIALRPGETFRLKREVSQLDPNAFVIVAYANEVLGGGFKHLVPPSAH